LVVAAGRKAGQGDVGNQRIVRRIDRAPRVGRADSVNIAPWK
jgi:hypothetical protein